MPDAPRSSLLAVLGVLLIYSVAGAHGHCWDSGWCRDRDTEAEVMECLRACRLVLSNELPVYPGNGHMQPLSENNRKYVMGHFRWSKFGKSNNNGSDFGHKREDLSRDSTVDIFPVSSQAQDGWEGDTRGDQESVERQEGKRSYAMEHFRWGKPVGRKRRPIKIYITQVQPTKVQPTQAQPTQVQPTQVQPTQVQPRSSESPPPQSRRDLSWESDYPELGSPEEKKNGKATTSEEEEQPGEVTKDSTDYKIHHFRWNVPASPKKKRYGGFMTSERSNTPLVTLFKNAIIKTAYKKGQ